MQRQNLALPSFSMEAMHNLRIGRWPAADSFPALAGPSSLNKTGEESVYYSTLRNRSKILSFASISFSPTRAAALTTTRACSSASAIRAYRIRRLILSIPQTTPPLSRCIQALKSRLMKKRAGDTRFGEPDGSFFARTGAIYKIKTQGTAPGQQDYKNNQNLASERWHRYEIEVTNQDYIVRLNGQEATRFQRSPTDTVRGNPPSVDPKSGFVGLQTHTGKVAFANVRIKTT